MYVKSSINHSLPKKNRMLQPGQKAKTDFHGSDKLIEVTITEVKLTPMSQSGISYKVTPALLKSDANAWYDADWFIVQ